MSSRFSRRTYWPPATNAISKAVEARQRTGLPIIDLTETNPTRVGLPPLADDLLAALSSSTVRTYAPEPFGMAAARAAVSAYHSHAVSPEHICLTASTSEAYTWLFKLLCEPGDRVLVPAPSYPLFEFLAQLESVEIATYPTRSWDDWSIDFEGLENSVDDRTRAVLLVSPNNPTGAMLHATDLPRLADLCERRGLALIADEVFADFAERRADRIATLAGFDRVLTFVLSGLSKVCLLPQLKVGWIAVSGPVAERDEALRRLELVADSFLSVNTPAQTLVGPLLARRDEVQEPLRKRIRTNRLVLQRCLEGTSATLLPADGGWNAVLRVPRDWSEEEWVLALLEQEAVLVHPGFFFDFAEDHYLVVSLIPDEVTFARAAQLLVKRFSDRG